MPCSRYGRPKRVAASRTEPAVRNERTRLLERRTERDPEVVALSQSIRDLEQQLLPLGRTYASSVERQANDASDWPDLLSKDNIRLIRAFSNIGDAEVRRRIMSLILAVTEGTDEVGFLTESGVLARDSHAP